jgi:hypothetical protein
MLARCEAKRSARSIHVFGRPTSSFFELTVAVIGAPIKLAAASFLGAVELAATPLSCPSHMRHGHRRARDARHRQFRFWHGFWRQLGLTEQRRS